MPGSTDPGGGGDPYIYRLDGTSFQIDGTPGRRYCLIHAPGVRILGRVAAIPGDPEQRTFFESFDVEVGDEKKIVVMHDGRTHVVTPDAHVQITAKVCTLDAPGHGGCTTEDDHPLKGIAHLNVSVPRHPPEWPGATGLCVDHGADHADPEQYAVEG